MNKISYTPVIISVVYLHALIAFFGFPRLSVKYAKIKAGTIGNNIEDNLLHWSYDAHLYIVAIAIFMLNLGSIKNVRKHYFPIVILTLFCNLCLTSIWLTQLFK